MDFSSYEFTGVEPLSVEEIAAADCKFDISRSICVGVHNLSAKASSKARRVSMCAQRNFSTVRMPFADNIPA